MKEMSLSQVKEELSGISRETDNYNTPNNEPDLDDRLNHINPSARDIPMKDIISIDQKTTVERVIAAMEETNV